MTDGCDVSSEIAFRWTSLNLGNDKSTLVQVMARCRQARSHYLNQCRPRSLPPYGVTRPQWVNLFKKHHWGWGCTPSLRVSRYAQWFCTHTIFSIWTHVDELCAPQIWPKSIIFFPSCWVPFWTSSSAPLLIFTPIPHPLENVCEMASILFGPQCVNWPVSAWLLISHCITLLLCLGISTLTESPISHTPQYENNLHW